MASDDKLKELEARIDRIEKWIHVVTRDARVGTEPKGAQPEGDKFELVSFDVKKVSRAAASVTYGYKLQVRNLTNVRLEMYGKVVFVDADGFEMEGAPIAPFRIAPAQVTAVSGQATIFDSNTEARTADIRAVLQAL
jgi:hypothetical protein